MNNRQFKIVKFVKINAPATIDCPTIYAFENNKYTNLDIPLPAFLAFDEYDDVFIVRSQYNAMFELHNKSKRKTPATMFRDYFKHFSNVHDSAPYNRSILESDDCVTLFDVSK